MRCAYCGVLPLRCTDKRSGLLVEHVVPDSRGGDDSIENTAMACSQCNTMKGDRTPLEMIFQRAGAWPEGVHKRHWRASALNNWLRHLYLRPAPSGPHWPQAQADGA